MRLERVAIQRSLPPRPPARSDSNTIVSSSEVNDGEPSLVVPPFSSPIATGAPNAAVADERVATNRSVRVPPLARVEPKYIRSRSADSHGRVVGSPAMPVSSGVISPSPLSRKTP